MSSASPTPGGVHVLCCPNCSYMTLLESNLTKHLNVEHGVSASESSVKVHRCTVCKTISTQWALMLDHVALYHDESDGDKQAALLASEDLCLQPSNQPAQQQQQQQTSPSGSAQPTGSRKRKSTVPEKLCSDSDEPATPLAVANSNGKQKQAMPQQQQQQQKQPLPTPTRVEKQSNSASRSRNKDAAAVQSLLLQQHLQQQQQKLYQTQQQQQQQQQQLQLQLKLHHHSQQQQQHPSGIPAGFLLFGPTKFSTSALQASPVQQQQQQQQQQQSHNFLGAAAQPPQLQGFSLSRALHLTPSLSFSEHPQPEEIPAALDLSVKDIKQQQQQAPPPPPPPPLTPAVKPLTPPMLQQQAIPVPTPSAGSRQRRSGGQQPAHRHRSSAARRAAGKLNTAAIGDLKSPAAAGLDEEETGSLLMSGGGGGGGRSKAQRQNFSPAQNRLLLKWFNEHSDKPYPSGDDTKELSEITGLNYAQVKKWFANKRMRSKVTGQGMESQQLSAANSPHQWGEDAELCDINRIDQENLDRPDSIISLNDHPMNSDSGEGTEC